MFWPGPVEKSGKARVLTQEKVQSGTCSQPLHKQFPQCLRISRKEASDTGKEGEFKTTNKSLERIVPPLFLVACFFF